MRRQIIATAVTGALSVGVVAAVAIGGGSASAAELTYFYGYAGGSQIRAADSRITSDLSVESTVTGTTKPVSDSKDTARLTVGGGVLNAGAVSTSSALKATLGGYTMTSTAKTTGVSLLNGLITADAVTTTSTSTSVNGKLTSTAKTQFANLHIAGLKLPVNIPTNYGVRIPGVATVDLNMVVGGTSGNTTIGIGSGLGVTLLKAQGPNAVGASIYLSPTYTSAETSDVPDTGHKVAGLAYGTKISAAAGTALSVKADPTAPIATPAPGTNGAVKSTTVLGVNVAPVITAGAVTDSVKATNTTAAGDSLVTSKVASSSLLGGLIKVGAVTSTAHSVAATGKTIALTGSSTIARLTISGKSIPVNVAPNTTISLGSLGKVVLNEQTKSVNTIVVAALHITLSTATDGLPAGAEITVGVASASSS